MGMPRASIASGQREIFQVHLSLELRTRNRQDFPSPDLTIGTVSRAIVCEPDRGSEVSVFGKTTSDVCVMVLHTVHG